MNRISRQNKLVIEFLLMVVCVIGLAGCSALREQIPTATPKSGVQVTAEQVAQAMQEDHFYSDYDLDTLLVQGTISSVNQQGSKLLVELNTNSPMGVVCELDNASNNLHVGQDIIVSAQAKDAQRTTTYVLLKNCTFPHP